MDILLGKLPPNTEWMLQVQTRQRAANLLANVEKKYLRTGRLDQYYINLEVRLSALIEISCSYQGLHRYVCELVIFKAITWSTNINLNYPLLIDLSTKRYQLGIHSIFKLLLLFKQHHKTEKRHLKAESKNLLHTIFN